MHFQDVQTVKQHLETLHAFDIRKAAMLPLKQIHNGHLNIAKFHPVSVQNPELYGCALFRHIYEYI